MSQAEPSAPSPRALKWTLIGSGGFLALFVAAVFVVRAIVGGGGPSDVTERYLDAVQDRDRAAVREVTCRSPDRSVSVGLSDNEEIVRWEVTGEQTRGQQAEVRVTITVSDEGETESGPVVVSLVRESGEWKVCAITAGGPGE